MGTELISDSMYHYCEHCDKVWKLEEIDTHIPDFSERVAPGEICPSGVCPACKILVHECEIPKERVLMAAFRNATLNLQEDGEIEHDPSGKVSMGDDNGAYVQMWKWVPGSMLRYRDQKLFKKFQNDSE